MSWLQAFGLALLLGLAAWAGTRVGNWQDARLHQKRIDAMLEMVHADVEQVLAAAEEVKSAGQQDRGPNDGL